MDLGLKGKIAIVCGGSRGMGRAIAAQLVDEQCRVAILARDKETLAKTARELDPKETGKVLPIECDLSDVQKIPSIVAKVKEKFGTIHILINNAGGPPPGGLEQVKDEDWDKAFKQNLLSAIIMTKEVLPIMKAQKFGRIVNITSQYVKEPFPGLILSNTARAGVVAFAKSISHEIAPFNITVNTLCPGAILTERLKFLMTERARRESKDIQKIEEDVRNMVPMKRVGTPEEFAHVVLFLVSEKASYVTGTTLAVDGGITKSLL